MNATKFSRDSLGVEAKLFSSRAEYCPPYYLSYTASLFVCLAPASREEKDQSIFIWLFLFSVFDPSHFFLEDKGEEKEEEEKKKKKKKKKMYLFDCHLFETISQLHCCFSDEREKRDLRRIEVMITILKIKRRRGKEES